MTRKTRFALNALAALSFPVAMLSAYAGFTQGEPVLIGLACWMIAVACVIGVAADTL